MAKTDVSFIQPTLPGWWQALRQAVDMQPGKKLGLLLELRAHRIAKEKEEVTGSAHNTFLDPLLRASFTLLREDLFVLPDLLGMTFKLYSHLRIGMGKTYRNWHKRNFQCHTVEVIQRLSQPTQAVWKLCLTPHS